MMKSSKSLLAVTVISLITISLLAGCKGNSEQASVAPQKSANDNLPAISVIAAQREVIVDQVLVSGLIEPIEQVFVAPQIEGQPIDSVNVDVGHKVKAGQILATLSSESLGLQKDQLIATLASAQAGIAQAQAQIVEAGSAQREARQARERAASLAKRGVVSQASLDTARAQASGANARVNAARQALKGAEAQVQGVTAQIGNIDYRLARTEVRAPVAGIVSARNAHVGAMATASGKPMFELIQDGALELRADVAEQDLVRLRHGQPAIIKLTGLAAPVNGKVRLVEPTVNRDSRLGRVRIQIDSDDAARAGMFAEATIELRRGEAIVLPVSAVGIDSNGDTALRVDSNIVKRVSIKTGARSKLRVEIISGINEGDIVVERAGAFVRDGDKIRPIDSAKTPRRDDPSAATTKAAKS